MIPGSQDDTTKSLGAGELTVFQRSADRPAAATSPSSPTVRLQKKDANRLPIGTRLFEFEITGVIGEGGFGIVYTAHDHSLDRDVAIKEYMPSGLATRVDGTTVAVSTEEDLETFDDGRRSFVNEARLLARFDHPSLLKVFRYWEANGTAYMAMPHYKGETLKQRLKRTGPPGEEWLRSILAQLLDALDVIHREDCFHRDIAPDNILLVDNDRPVLLDFGAARRVIKDMTQALTVILKPGFAPIEQYADVPKLRQGPWTDLYALGAVVFHAVTGEKPPASIGRYVSDDMLPLSETAHGRYSPELLAAIDAALRVRPDERPQDVDALRALLALPSNFLAAAPIEVAAASAAVPVTRTIAPTIVPAAAPTSGVEAPAIDAAVTAPPTRPIIVKPAEVAATTQDMAAAPGAAPAAASAPGLDAVAGAISAGQPETVDIRKAAPAARARPQPPVIAPVKAAIGAVILIAIGGAIAGHFLAGAPPASQESLSPPLPSVHLASTPAAAAGGQPLEPTPDTSATTARAAAAPNPAPPVKTSIAGPVTTSLSTAPETVPAPRSSPFVPPAKAPPPRHDERVSRFLAEANTSLAHNEFARAEGLARQALALEPGNAAALNIQHRAQKAAWAEVQDQ